MGGIDKSMNFSAVEITGENERFKNIYGKDYNIITDSDAHNLGAISEAANYLALSKIKTDLIIDYLKFY